MLGDYFSRKYESGEEMPKSVSDVMQPVFDPKDVYRRQEDPTGVKPISERNPVQYHNNKRHMKRNP